MKVRLRKGFHFEASHRLDHLSSDHPCYNLHGHSYKVDIEVEGEVDPKTGFLIDYADIRKAVTPIIDQLDHRHLNDIEDLELTSTEYICAWLWKHLKPALPILSRIIIRETGSNSCEYTGE